MANDIKVKINLATVIGKVGFGIPLILAGMQEKATDYKEYGTLEEITTAGYAATTDVYKCAQLLFSQEDAPAKIAICTSTETAVATLPTIKDKGWRQLIVTSVGTEGESTTEEIATWIESTSDKMYFARVTETTGLTKLVEYKRSVLFYYPEGEETLFPEAALVGATAGKDVGSFTYKNIILKGVEPLELTDAEITAIHTAGCITIVAKAGDNVTTEGKVANGEYIDIIDSIDYVISDMEYRMQKRLNLSDKIPFDNVGIAILEATAITVLQEAYANKIIATRDDGTADYSVYFAPRSATPNEDRQSRTYNGGTFSFGLAGAIHYANVIGEIEI